MGHTGDLLAELLRRYGVTKVFGVPGGQTAALYDGIGRAEGLEHVLVADERSAAYAADAYARVTGRPGVCDVTVGPGTTKLPDGLLEALNASVPMVAIVGELPRDWEPLRDHGIGSQGFDQRAMLQTMTKGTWTVPNQQTLPQLVRTAFRVATCGRPGPVALIVPHDVFDEEWQQDADDLAVDSRHVRVPAHRPRAGAEDLTRGAEILAAAERPLIIVGGGVHTSRAYAELARVAELADAAVVTSFTGKGAFPETSPHSAGVLNPLGSPAAPALAERADTLLWVGCKVGQNTSLNWTLPKSGQRNICLDMDGAELGRTFAPDAELAGDAAETLGALAEKLTPQAHPAWIAELRADPAEIPRQSPPHPAQVLAELDELLGIEDIVVSDASFAAGWIATYLRAREPGRRFLFARGLGGLGYAIPAALGAAAAIPGARVITISGDGGASYALGELATHARHGYRGTHIVLNNGTLGWLKIWQHLFFDQLNQSVDLGGTSFSGVAAALGCEAVDVSTSDGVKPVLRQALDAERPCLVDVRCPPWDTPVHGYRRRLDEGGSYPRPGSVYEARPWSR